AGGRGVAAEAPARRTARAEGRGGYDPGALRRHPGPQLRRRGGDRARSRRRGREARAPWRPRCPARGPRPPAGRAAREAADREGARGPPVTLSEARLSYLSHALQTARTGEKLGEVGNGRLFLAGVKRAPPAPFSPDGRPAQLAGARMPKGVVRGSREWDVLYRRYYEEERRKLGS